MGPITIEDAIRNGFTVIVPASRALDPRGCIELDSRGGRLLTELVSQARCKLGRVIDAKRRDGIKHYTLATTMIDGQTIGVVEVKDRLHDEPNAGLMLVAIEAIGRFASKRNELVIVERFVDALPNIVSAAIRHLPRNVRVIPEVRDG